MSTSLKPTELPPTEAEFKVLAPIEPEATEPEAVEPESTEVQPLKGLDRLRSNRWLMGLLMLIPIMGFSYFAYRQFVIVPQQQAKSKVQTAPVGRGNLPITISANGTVQPERSVNVSPKAAGILKQLLVKEGDEVQQGQVLAYMDDSNLQGELQRSQGNLAAAVANVEKLRNENRDEEITTAQAQLAEQDANLQKLRNGNRSQELAETQAKLKDAQYALRQANDDLQRNQALYAEGAISLQSLNTFRKTRDRAQTQVSQAEQAASLMRSGTRPEEITQAEAVVQQKEEALSRSEAGPRSEDIDEAQAQMTAAQGAMQIIQASLDDLVLRAPFTGVVSRKFADPGAFVTPTTAGSAVSSATSSSILSLASTNQVIAQVAEANIAQIRMGLAATIQVDAYPGKPFTGRVTQIATQSNVVQNVTSFEVKTSVSDSQRLLKSGMNVSLEFKAGELKNVLVVPTAAIVQQTNAQGVFVAKDKADPVFVPITIGITMNDKTEVKSG